VFDHLERVLVSRIAVKEFVLDQTRQAAELGQVLAQKFHLVHQAQDAGDLSLVLEDARNVSRTPSEHWNERSTSFRFAGFAIATQGLVPLPLLHVVEQAHQTQRVVFENHWRAAEILPSRMMSRQSPPPGRPAEERAEPRCFAGLSARRSASALVSRKILRECT